MILQDLYEEIILSRQGVLFIEGKPGTGKSAIIKEIAKKNNFNFIDVRLSQIDSSEVLGIPKVTIMEDGTEVMKYAIPHWAYLANQGPTIVFFDEANRALIEVRNAALQILLDHEIGHDFKFNDNVYFASAGNLGEEDGCEVEEFDSALNGRLVTIKHELEIKEWKEKFANENVNPYIIDFIDANPSYFYKLEREHKNYANPRSWTFLSNVITKEEKDIEKVINKTQRVGTYYVGTGVTRFLSYLRETQSINIKDVIIRYEQIEKQLEKIARSKMSQLVKELEAIDLNSLRKHELENVIKFLKIIDDDERIGLFKYITDKYVDFDSKTDTYTFSNNVEKIVKSFEEDMQIIFTIDDNELKK